MTDRITGAREWADGFSNLVVTRDVSGRISFGVHDITRPGFTASFAPETVAEIAAFIKGDA